MNHVDVKEIAYSLGADLCGIAGIDRFDGAPEGYHPIDVLTDAELEADALKRHSVQIVICV